MIWYLNTSSIWLSDNTDAKIHQTSVSNFCFKLSFYYFINFWFHSYWMPISFRVIIWGARSLSFRGLRKDSIDAQITCSIDCAGYHGTQDIQQSTDVHYFSRNGNAVFNWRVIYSRIILPVSSCVLQISAYDFRTIGSAVFVGEVRSNNINLC